MHRFLLPLGVLAAVAACQPSPERLRSELRKHPEIVADAIRAHPTEIMEALQFAADSYQKVARTRADAVENDRIGRELAAPRHPVIQPGRAIRGNVSAPVTIVEYSDFQCPFCRRDEPVLRALLDKYKGKLRLVLKQTPLPIHPHARAAAEMFEAVLLQGQDKAWRFHDLLFANQERLSSEGERYIEAAAREAGADLARARRDAASPAVKALIEADISEFQQVGFSGTPGFLINGVVLDGAHPPEDFERIIGRVLGSE